MSKVIIVSRHPGAIAWVKAQPEYDAEVRQNPTSAIVEVKTEVSAADVRGAVVFGNLPLHLAAVCGELYAVEFTGAPPRGAEYGVEEMVRAGGHLTQYVVVAGSPHQFKCAIDKVAVADGMSAAPWVDWVSVARHQ